jgi:hypothetical protein
MRKNLLLFITTLLILSCNNLDHPLNYLPDDSDFGDFYVLALPPNSDGDNQILVELNDGVLRTGAYYSGGCEDHHFKLFFRLSSTSKANLWIVHNANNDMCEAYIWEPLEFDLPAELKDILELFLLHPGPTSPEKLR